MNSMFKRLHVDLAHPFVHGLRMIAVFSIWLGFAGGHPNAVAEQLGTVNEPVCLWVKAMDVEFEFTSSTFAPGVNFFIDGCLPNADDACNDDAARPPRPEYVPIPFEYRKNHQRFSAFVDGHRMSSHEYVSFHSVFRIERNGKFSCSCLAFSESTMSVGGFRSFEQGPFLKFPILDRIVPCHFPRSTTDREDFLSIRPY